jgi:anti-sigma regulatory factor (Ser/Thr protein kinase)
MSGSQVEALVLPGHPDQLGDSLGKLRKYITEVSNIAGLEPQAMHRLRLAVDEIAANIIMYGYANADPAGTIKVTTTIEDSRLIVVLEDTGVSYNPLERELPDNLDEPLETREIGGLGVFLAVRNVDEFDYQRIENRNRNIFVVYRR